MSDSAKDFVAVYEIHNASELALIKSLLDEKDINYYVDGENFTRMHGHALPSKVMVDSSQAELAAQLLKDISDQ